MITNDVDPILRMRPSRRRLNQYSPFSNLNSMPFYSGPLVLNEIDHKHENHFKLKLPVLPPQMRSSAEGLFMTSMEDHCIPMQMNLANTKRSCNNQTHVPKRCIKPDEMTDEEFTRLKRKSKDIKKKVFGSSKASILPNRVIIPQNMRRVMTVRPKMGVEILLSPPDAIHDIKSETDCNNNVLPETGGSDKPIKAESRIADEKHPEVISNPTEEKTGESNDELIPDINANFVGSAHSLVDDESLLSPTAKDNVIEQSAANDLREEEKAEPEAETATSVNIPTNVYTLTQTYDDVHLVMHPDFVQRPGTYVNEMHSRRKKFMGHKQYWNKWKRNLLKNSGVIYPTTPFTRRKIAGPTEEVVRKTACEVLLEIAAGKWKNKNTVLDDSRQKPRCTNFHCVRAAEKDEKRKQKLQQKQILRKNNNQNGVETVIFEDGELPSYHSLLKLWDQNTQRFTWSKQLFANGVPTDEQQFLNMWRGCRRNPEAYGISLSAPKKLPKLHPTNSKPNTSWKSKNDERQLKRGAKTMERTPVRLPSIEYYNEDSFHVPSAHERVLQRKRYEEFRRMYPHLPPLRPVDYKMSPTTVKLRLKQAEDWHRLITVKSRGISDRENSDSNLVYTLNPDGEFLSRTNILQTSPLTVQEARNIPRYASSTTCSVNKIRRRVT